MFDVATVGDNCIDRYGPPLDFSTVGGNAVNVAIQLASLGGRTAYFGAVGDDADGRRVVSALRSRNVDVDHVITRRMVTAFTNIEFDAGGERVFAFEEFGACQGYAPTAPEVAVLSRLRHVHLGWLDDSGAVKRTLAAAGVTVSQDLSVNAAARDLQPDGLSIAFLSMDGSRAEAEALLRRTLDAGVRSAVVMMGHRGSMASDGRTWAFADAQPVEPVDTTGAGDTFIAAFLTAQMAGRDLQASLEAARLAAAVTCLHYGGFPQEPAPRG